MGGDNKFQDAAGADIVSAGMNPTTTGKSSLTTAAQRDLAGNVEILIPSIKPERGEGWPNQIKDGESVAPDVIDGAVNSPHGVAVNSSGTVFFTEWYFGGRVVRIY
jgi:hypothetical protein